MIRTNPETTFTGVGRPLPYLPLFLLSLGHGIVDILGGALPMLLPLLKLQFHLSYTDLGMIAMLFNLSSTVIQPVCGVISDRVSCLWMLPLGCALAAGMALVGVSSSYQVLLICILLCGLGNAVYHPEGAKQTYLISGDHKAIAQSIYAIGGNLGYGLGPAAAALLLGLGGMKEMGWLLVPALLTTVLLIIKMPALARLRDRSRRCPRVRPVNRKAGRLQWGAVTILVLIVAVRSLIYLGVTTFTPLYYLNYLKADHAFAGLFLSAFLLAGVLGSVVGGSLADRYGNRKILFFSFLLAIPPLWLQLYTSGIASITMAALSGFALISTFSITVVLAQEMVPGHLGLASGLMLGLGSGIAALGSPLFGLIADNWGLPLVLKLVGVIPVAALLLILALPNKCGVASET